ncbi:TonB-dependent receptor [Massilia sp.]|uniref:TonB-dependent receptor n=1 Tax=Massilia sp. TaxID=1882437 RepID=UPI00289BA781|nr:TonB-dependent receptor [Massilia sp.]
MAPPAAARKRPTTPLPSAVATIAAAVRTLATLAAPAAIGAAAIALPAPALAQGEAARQYTIGAGTLEQALNRFGRAAGITLSFAPALTDGIDSPGLQGRHTVDGGLARLLAGSGLEAVRQPNGDWSLRRSATAASASGAAQQAPVQYGPLPAVHVTGSANRDDALAPGGQVARAARLGILGEVGVMEAPFNITSYTSQLIEDQQARGLMDVLENDPSVRSSSPIDSEGDIVMVRGFELWGREVTINGMGGLADNRGHVLEAVERVEVLKGPSALINSISPWGASTGGSVNYVLKRAGDTPLTRLTASHYTRSQLGLHLDAGRRFGDGGQFGARVNLSQRKGDGAVDQTNNRTSVGALALDWRGQRLRLTLDGGYQEKKLTGGLAASRIGSSVPIPRPPKASTNFKQPWETFESDNRYLALGAEYDLAPGWTLAASHGQSLSNEVYLLTVHTISNVNGDLSGWAQFIPGRSTNRSTDLSLRGGFATGAVKHRVTLAGNHSVARRGQAASIVGAVVPSNLYAPLRQPYRDTQGLSTDVDMLNRYGRSSLAVTDTMSMWDDSVFLMVGARKQDVDNRSYARNAATRELRQSFRYDQDQVTPAAGLVVKLAPRLSVYGNYIESLIPGPTPSPVYYANGNQTFPPFPSKQYESGVKYEHERLSVTASVYQITLQSTTEVDAPVAGGLPTLELNGEQRNRGFELNTFGEAAPGLRLLGGVALIDARLLHTQGGLTDGRRARGVPKKNLNLGAEWDLHVPGLTVTLRGVYTGSSFIDTTNSAARTAPSWTRFDAGLRYAANIGGKDVTLRASVDNLANRDYWSSASRGVLVLGAPRSVRLSLSTDL